ncbi:BREX system ATP-binding protein BrxD [Sphaerisporangium perillae]|uniref:BREX system ATP-binding protein BrxD n=1 Tax=Sphaerisporangium perillae TaxID=2935860 RepID=UPI00200F351F|nr:BREX system ATP-binding protein BrxD [Sphaerisporangium perillae]
MAKVSRLRRRRIIDALSRGTVPQSDLDLFAIGMERFEKTLDEDLSVAAGGGAGFKAIRGEYGSGKTFFARWLAERAKRMRMATSEVQISDGDTPLHHPQAIYRGLIRSLSTAGSPPSALRDIVDAWLFRLEEEVEVAKGISRDDRRAIGAAVDERIESRLSGVSRNVPAFATALRFYRQARLSGDAATADGLLAWVGGQQNVAASIRRYAGLKGEVDASNAYSFMEGLLTVLRDCGHPGLLLVLDEVETVQRLRSDFRLRSFEALRGMIDNIDRGKFPGLYLVITGTPAFYEGRQGVQLSPPLAQRLHTDFATDARFDTARAIQIRLTGFDHDRLVELGCVVRDLYAQGDPAGGRIMSKVDDGYVKDLATAVAGHLGVGTAPRVFLRKLVADVLFRVSEHEDFDPRVDYKQVKLAESELTAEEQNAMRTARRPMSAAEVDLDLP